MAAGALLCVNTCTMIRNVASAMVTTMSWVQAGVDMMGVVTSAGQLGSVKRKSDNSELSRRDVTLLDQRYSIC